MRTLFFTSEEATEAKQYFAFDTIAIGKERRVDSPDIFWALSRSESGTYDWLGARKEEQVDGVSPEPKSRSACIHGPSEANRHDAQAGICQRLGESFYTWDFNPRFFIPQLVASVPEIVNGKDHPEHERRTHAFYQPRNATLDAGIDLTDEAKPHEWIYPSEEIVWFYWPSRTDRVNGCAGAKTLDEAGEIARARHAAAQVAPAVHARAYPPMPTLGQAE